MSAKFNQIIIDFKRDLEITYPELKNILEESSLEEYYTICSELYPKKFFEILYENETLFENECFLLPKVDFTILMKDVNVTEKTKKTIWKYLQLILFSVLESLNTNESFGDTSKMFEAINEDDLHKKIAETMEGMKDFFDVSGIFDTSKFTDFSGIPDISDNFMDPDKLKTHLDGLMNGKIGNLAKEIAEETANSIGNQEEFMQTLMKNPTKILSLVKDIGGKLEEKIKKGDVNQSELLAEATEIMDKMKDIPGLKQMMSKICININIDFKAMKNKMEQTMKMAKTKERMNKKRESKMNPENKSENKPENKPEIFKKDDFNFVVKVDDTTQPKSQKPRKRNKKKKSSI